MSAPVILVQASPRVAADGSSVTVRLAGGGADKPYNYSGQDWKAGIVQPPTFVASINFSGGDTGGAEFGAGGVPQAAEIEWAPGRVSDLAGVANLFWIDAPVTVRIGPEGALPPVALTGKALAGLVEGGVLKLSLSDPAADLKKPLLTARYGGTGDLDGPAEWEGKIKRRVWGKIWNLQLEPIDKANNIYAASDPLQKLQAIDAVRDRGVAAASLTFLAWQGSAAATLTALRAATAPDGGGVVCPSIACVKWWTVPSGLCADLRGEIGAGYVDKTADIVARIVQAGANTPFAAGTVAAAATARPAAVGWVAKDDTTSQAAMIEELLGNSSLLWLLNASGEIVLREWAWGGSAASVASIEVRRTETLRPLVTRRLGYLRNETPMARGDIAGIVFAEDTLLPDGTPVDEAFAAIPIGVNAAVNSEWRLIDKTYSTTLPLGWLWGWYGDSTPGLTTAQDLFPMADGLEGWYFAWTGNPNGTAFDAINQPFDTLEHIKRFCLPIAPGDRIGGSIRVGHQNCIGGQCNIMMLDENGAYVGEVGGTVVSHDIGASALISLKRSDLALAELVFTVPPDGDASLYSLGTKRPRFAVLRPRYLIAGSPANPRAVCSAPLIARLASGQTIVPPYSPGPPDRIATNGADWIDNLARKPKIYHAVSKGQSASYTPNPGLFDETGALAISSGVVGRAYTVTVFNRSDGSLASSTLYDVFGSTANATAMASALNALGSDKIVVITTYDEPQTNRMFGTLPAAMYRCGASPAVYGSANIFKYRSAYVLIGIPGMGKAAGFEAYQGEADSSAGAWLDVPFMIYQGNPIVSATAYTNSSVKDLDFVGELDADKTGSHTANDTANVGGTPAATVLGNIATAASNAQSALDELDDLADDAILSINEKITKLIPQAAALEASYTSLATLAGALGVSASTASSARSSWLSVLSGISPAWNSTGADSPVVRSTFNTALTNYQGALSALASDCAAMAATKASWSGVSGAGKAEDNATRNVGRGDYAAGTAYNPGDVVKWPVSGGGDGGGHIRIGTGATTGVAPSDTSKWAVFVEKGDTGGQGVPGPALFTLVNHNGTTLTTDSITKTGGTNGAWDASAYSAEGYVSGAFAGATVTAASTATMFGLNQDPTTNASYDTLDFAFYVNGSNVLEIWESNTFIASYGGVSPGDVLSISYDDKQTVYYKNGTALRTIAATAGLRLCYDTSLLFTGGKVSGIKFGPAGKAGDIGAGGVSTWLTNPNPSIATTSGGAPKADELDKIAGKFVITKGGVVQTSGVVYSIVSGSLVGLAGLTINSSTGAYDGASGISGTDHEATLRATMDGIDYDLPLTVTTAPAGSAANGGRANITALTNGTTYSANASFDVPIGIDGVCDITWTLTTYGAASGNYQPQCKAAYFNLTAGTGPFDVPGSEVTLDSLFPGDTSGGNGSGSFTNTTGASQNFRIFFYSHRVSPSGSSTGVSGNIVAEIS